MRHDSFIAEIEDSDGVKYEVPVEYTFRMLPGWMPEIEVTKYEYPTVKTMPYDIVDEIVQELITKDARCAVTFNLD